MDQVAARVFVSQATESVLDRWWMAEVAPESDGAFVNIWGYQVRAFTFTLQGCTATCAALPSAAVTRALSDGYAVLPVTHPLLALSPDYRAALKAATGAQVAAAYLRA